MVERYLAPIEAWASGGEQSPAPGDRLSDQIQSSLGERDPAKVFLASLLVSLLRAQQLAAKQRSERRAAQST